MAKKVYGNTWWGRQWLNALTHIDNDNRLPRGIRYANNGSVLKVKIDKNIIQADVAGSRPRPYKVEIEIPVFTDREKEVLQDIMANNPGIQASLMNQELPETFEKLLKKHSVSLFPKRWTDLKMSCSCPDYAVPCKHIAAVIYISADELDRSPLLLPTMKGLVLNPFKDSKSSVKNEDAPITTQVYFFQNGKIDSWYNPDKYKSFPDDLIPDYSQIPDFRDSLYRILSPAPLFSDGDFREDVDAALRKLSRKLQNWEPCFIPSENSDAIMEILRKGSIPAIQFDQELNPSGVIYVNNQGKKTIHTSSFADFLLTIGCLESHELADVSVQTAYLWHVFNFSLQLCKQSAIRPILTQCKKDTFRIFWLPAQQIPEVRNMYQVLENNIKATICVRGKELTKFDQIPQANQQVNIICMAFIHLLIGEFCAETPVYYKAPRNIFEPPIPVRELAWDMFFGGMIINFTGFGNESKPLAIQKWLEKLDLRRKQWNPVLKIRTGRNDTFFLDVLAEEVKEEPMAPLKFMEFLKQKISLTEKQSFLKDLHQLTGIVPEINRILDNGGKKSIPVLPENLLGFLMRDIPLLTFLGIQVLLPKILRNLIYPKLSIKVKSSKPDIDSFMKLQYLLEFDWQISVGDESLTPKEFEKLVKKGSGLVKLRSGYLLITAGDLEKIRNRIENGERPGPEELMHAALSGDFSGLGVELTDSLKKIIEQIKAIINLPVPKGIQAELRPYQQRGYEWMYKNVKIGMGSLLADDMGLGKTLQTITLLEKLREEKYFSKNGPGLIVLPTSLISNWQQELQKFAPRLKSFVFHGNNRRLQEKGYDIILTTYGTLRRDVKYFNKNTWPILIIDEAQNIKNPNTEQTKAVKKIVAPLKIALSGTPVENRLSDYWSIFDFTIPGYLGSAKTFQKEYAIPIARFHQRDRIDKFRKITSPFIMRRVKTDPLIIQDLPDKIIQNIRCNLEPGQASVYENIVKECMRIIEESTHPKERQGLVLKMLIQLKQVCNHPTQFLKKGRPMASESGKSRALMDIVSNVLDASEKCLIFTQFRQMGELLRQMFQEELKVEADMFHGGLTRGKRDNIIHEFKELHHKKILILSLKAGGTGLNLVNANHVIHYDLWWNPAVENQATDRAFRIGQNKNVMVYRLLTEGTLEEKIDLMLNSKKMLAELTVNEGEAWIGNLSNQELNELVRLT